MIKWEWICNISFRLKKNADHRARCLNDTAPDYNWGTQIICKANLRFSNIWLIYSMSNEHKKMNSTMLIVVDTTLAELKLLKCQTKHRQMSSFIICLTKTVLVLILIFCVFALDFAIWFLVLIITFLLNELLFSDKSYRFRIRSNESNLWMRIRAIYARHGFRIERSFQNEEWWMRKGWKVLLSIINVTFCVKNE